MEHIQPVGHMFITSATDYRSEKQFYKQN